MTFIFGNLQACAFIFANRALILYLIKIFFLLAVRNTEEVGKVLQETEVPLPPCTISETQIK